MLGVAVACHQPWLPPLAWCCKNCVTAVPPVLGTCKKTITPHGTGRGAVGTPHQDEHDITTVAPLQHFITNIDPSTLV